MPQRSVTENISKVTALSWKVIGSNAGLLIFFGLVSFVINLAYSLKLSSIEVFVDEESADPELDLSELLEALVTIGVATSALIILNFIIVAALFHIISNKKVLSIGEALAIGVKNIPRLLLISIVVGALITFGFIALIIPGIIIAVLATFAPYVALDNRKLGPIEILKLSKDIFMTQPALPLLWFLMAIGVNIVLSILIWPITAGKEDFLVVASVIETIVGSAFTIIVSVHATQIYFVLKEELQAVKLADSSLVSPSTTSK